MIGYFAWKFKFSNRRREKNHRLARETREPGQETIFFLSCPARSPSLSAVNIPVSRVYLFRYLKSLSSFTARVAYYQWKINKRKTSAAVCTLLLRRRALRASLREMYLRISSAIFVLKERLVPVFGGFRVRGVQIWGYFFNWTQGNIFTMHKLKNSNKTKTKKISSFRINKMISSICVAFE